MGQGKSTRKSSFEGYMSNGQEGRDLSCSELSYDRRTDVRYDGTQTVAIGTRSKLPLMKAFKGCGDVFKQLGVVIRTGGNRFSRNAVVVVTDYYRVQDNKVYKRNRTQGESPNSWFGEYGPAEASGALRIGDILYAVNGRVVINKSKGQVLRMIQTLIENQAYPLILTWKHCETINQIPWELEQCMAPPEGEYCPPYKEWANPSGKQSSISI